MNDLSGNSEAFSAIRMEDSSIWIYGKGGTGLRTARILIESGFNVCGFIDRRANEIADADLPIRTLDEIETEIQDKHKIVVVICLKDVFQHEELARSLVGAGFFYLVYKPASFLNGSNVNYEAERVNGIYEQLVEGGHPPDADCIVPLTKSIPVCLNDRFFIEDCGETVLAWVPVEKVFNYSDSADYPGCNMPLMFGLVDLYNAFSGELSPGAYKIALQDFYLYCGEWLHKIGLSTDEKPLSGFVDSRAGVFQNLEKLAEINTEFFQKNAPSASYEEGKFYLVSSGRNRIAFQIARGAKYVPLRLLKVDYEAWCDLNMVHEVEHSLGKSAELCCFAPAPHPYLVDLPCEFADYMKLFVIPAAKDIVRDLYLQCVVTDERGVRHIDFERFEKMKQSVHIFEDMNDGGTLRNYFQSLGFTVVSNSSFKPGEMDVCFCAGDVKHRPLGRVYCLFMDEFPDWCKIEEENGEQCMFVSRGLKHCYMGVKL